LITKHIKPFLLEIISKITPPYNKIINELLKMATYRIKVKDIFLKQRIIIDKYKKYIFENSLFLKDWIL